MMLRTVFRRGTAMAAGILLALLASAGGSAGANNPNIRYVQGTISAPPGTRLDQLQVQLYEAYSPGIFGSAAVDASGRYRVPHDGAELVQLVVLGRGTGLADTWYGNDSRREGARIMSVTYSNLDNADIQMKQGATVSGRLTVPSGVDARNLSVAADYTYAGISPSTVPKTGRTAPVAADGSYRITGLGANTYTLRVVPGDTGLVETWLGGATDRLAARQINIAAGSRTQGLDIALRKPAKLQGTAVFPAGSVPETGFVEVYSPEGKRLARTSSGADGSFAVPAFPAGAVKIRFGPDSGASAMASTWYPTAGDLAAGEAVVMAEGEQRTGFKLKIQRGGSITGTVSGASPQDGVSVSVREPSGRQVKSGVPDKTGRYTLRGLNPGAYKVLFTAFDNKTKLMPQYYPQVPVNLGPSAGADVVVTADKSTAGVNARMFGGGEITGTLRGTHGEEYPFAAVNVESTSAAIAVRYGLSDEHGRFTLAGLPDGDYTLRIPHLHYPESNFDPAPLYSGNVRDPARAQKISIRNGQSINVGELSFAASRASAASGKFTPIKPTRILDTRTTAFPLPDETIRLVQVGGIAGLPADISAVALNLTVTEPSADGSLSASASGDRYTATSNVDYLRGQTIPNYVVVGVRDGKIALRNDIGSGSAHVVADLAGYFTGGVPLDAGAFAVMEPQRIANFQGQDALPAGGQRDIQVTGMSDIPKRVSAVVVNLTAARAWKNGAWSTYGHLTAFASGTARPGTSTVNYDAARGDAKNLAVVPVGADGKISITNTSPMHVGVMVDVMGYFLAGDATAAGTLQTIAPKRFLDTRTSQGPVRAGGEVSVKLGGAQGIPSGARAAMVNLTVTEAKSFGFVTAYPAGQTAPGTSNLNYGKGQTIANFAIVPIGADGKINIRNTSSGSVQAIVDVVGYIRG
ncbi:hypothetical protein AB4089_05065 [Arthrobacter sp. 2MCAF15]|uniref:hypothetical protein n=1 Tax=Arthrobacter sp. 2MCAF15 TaxID=3232984 RepID=UPI003F9086AA